ncbi:MAG TPA: ferritin-like domain-containing protein [Acidimicrobiales bacterium]|jgi:rubrerythrin
MTTWLRPDPKEPKEPGTTAPHIDPGAMGALIEQSQDIHRDAMASTVGALDEIVETGAEVRTRRDLDPEESLHAAARRSRLMTGAAFGGGMLAAAGIGGALQALFSSAAFAASATDVQILQTAASIETLAVSTYRTALTLPFIGGASANPVVKTFATTTMQQHQQHLDAFNGAITGLGGKTRTTPDPALAKVVAAAVPGLTSPGAVVTLALELEQGAAETYVVDVATLSDTNAKKLTASIMGVEAQHASILLAVQALLNANAPQLITLAPGNVANLPAAAGSVGFPMAFFPTDQARPATEGASS